MKTADLKMVHANRARPMLRPSIFDPRAWKTIPVAQAVAAKRSPEPIPAGGPLDAAMTPAGSIPIPGSNTLCRLSGTLRVPRTSYDDYRDDLARSNVSASAGPFSRDVSGRGSP